MNIKKSPYERAICGVSYLGEGKYKYRENGVSTRIHVVWASMIARCYGEIHLKRRPNYRAVTVCEEWHNFQNFAKWYEENYKLHMDKWDLDKDILCKECKIYSPETCCFVPKQINQFLSDRKVKGKELPLGVTQINGRYRTKIKIKGKEFRLGVHDTIEEAFAPYKKAKESHGKELAEEWKDLIDIRVYQALYNYKVEITD